MVEKTITDKALIIQYNPRNKKAWFQTESMLTRTPIEIKRVINL